MEGLYHGGPPPGAICGSPRALGGGSKQRTHSGGTAPTCSAENDGSEWQVTPQPRTVAVHDTVCVEGSSR